METIETRRQRWEREVQESYEALRAHLRDLSESGQDALGHLMYRHEARPPYYRRPEELAERLSAEQINELVCLATEDSQERFTALNVFSAIFARRALTPGSVMAHNEDRITAAFYLKDRATEELVRGVRGASPEAAGAVENPGMRGRGYIRLAEGGTVFTTYDQAVDMLKHADATGGFPPRVVDFGGVTTMTKSFVDEYLGSLTGLCEAGKIELRLVNVSEDTRSAVERFCAHQETPVARIIDPPHPAAEAA